MKVETEKWSTSNKQEELKKKKKLKWVVPQIKIKVVDTKSPFYLKKFIVTELLSDREFECRDETGKTINDLSEKMIQTCIPKQGGPVLILRGNHTGEKGVILERKKNKGKVTVQTIE